MHINKLTGLVAAPFTPMDNMGQINLDQINALAQLYAKNQVIGAFICGTTGEGASLSRKEKEQVFERWGKVKGKVRTIAMVGGTSLPEMQELAIHAKEQQLDGFAVLCPYFLKPKDVHELVDFCAFVAEQAPTLPFYYYHIPSLTGGHYSMLEFLELAEAAIPNLAGIKYTHSNIMECHACCRYKDGKYTIFWGTDEALLSALVIGIEAAVGSTYNYAAPLYHQVIGAFESGEIKKAEELQYKSVQIVQLLQKYGGIGAGKAFMKLIGVDCGWSRPPVHSPTSVELSVLEKELQRINFFEYCSQT